MITKPSSGHVRLYVRLLLPYVLLLSVWRSGRRQPSLRMRAQRDVLADARNHGENRVLAACVGEPWVDIFDFPGPPTARGGRCQSALARGQRPCGANGIDLMTGISARRRPTDAGRRPRACTLHVRVHVPRMITKPSSGHVRLYVRLLLPYVLLLSVWRSGRRQPSLRMRAQRDVLADARNHGENRVLAACVGEPWVDIFDFPGPPTARGGRCQSALARGQRPCGANGIDLMTGISARRRPTDAGRR